METIILNEFMAYQTMLPNCLCLARFNIIFCLIKGTMWYNETCEKSSHRDEE